MICIDCGQASSEERCGYCHYRLYLARELIERWPGLQPELGDYHRVATALAVPAALSDQLVVVAPLAVHPIGLRHVMLTLEGVGESLLWKNHPPTPAATPWSFLTDAERLRARRAYDKCLSARLDVFVREPRPLVLRAAPDGKPCLRCGRVAIETRETTSEAVWHGPKRQRRGLRSVRGWVCLACATR